MYYALVHYLENPPKFIETIRTQHDPRANVLKPHLTLVFPTKKVDLPDLEAHILTVLRRWQPIPISWGEIIISQDKQIFLTVQTGRNLITQLHDDLYTGILQPHLRTDIPYEPHVTLGTAKTLDSQTGLKELNQFVTLGETIISTVSLVAFPELDAPDAWEKRLRIGS